MESYPEVASESGGGANVDADANRVVLICLPVGRSKWYLSFLV